MISRHQYCHDFHEKDGNNRLPENYLYFCRQNQNINVQDLLLAFVEILSPEWICYQGKIFIKERFQLDDVGKYENPDSAQFWINLVLVSELYADEISRDKIDRLAALIADNWNMSLKKQGLNGAAKIIEDEQTGEVFVSIVSV